MASGAGMGTPIRRAPFSRGGGGVLSSLRTAMQRTPSRSLHRSESAPTLAPLWENSESPTQPDLLGEPSEDGDAEDEPWLSSAHVSSSLDGEEFARLRSTAGHFGAPRERRPAPPSELPPPWERLLRQLQAGSSAGLSQSELVAAAQESLQCGSLPLRLGHGTVDQYYTMRRQLSVGKGFRVMEGVELVRSRHHRRHVATTCNHLLRRRSAISRSRSSPPQVARSRRTRRPPEMRPSQWSQCMHSTWRAPSCR